MNNEIKEILDMLKQHISIVSIEDEDLLLDYITNLQQENHELKSKLECYENGVYYSSKVDELTEENERLKEQMVAMVQPTYTYGISGGSSE